MPTKLEELLNSKDKGVKSATGTLSKILRTLWRETGMTHSHLAMRLEHWLADPNHDFPKDPVSINNNRGNLRKDLENGDVTWKLFVNNLRILRPVEIRFLVRLSFKNGHSYKAVAVMRPPSSKNPINDEFDIKPSEDYDDEGFHKSEKEFKK